ncbi:DUF1569 domain-containing protein [Mucilaginibacter psychrotolerans]|uniref:DUF1569 domain-containing protein n=1 Tax=Mucilaginibacter psychrotolerans TaxID=1524096 RepID=A0A4Y8SQU9_9SPHI|nr:DUF1569 domain-containing protein [Mucilaginibacter psychrotolerans]TFF40746.1 DUF1569 domain-containing protein [Mucilaginibacter psychrotolerans]
MKTTLDKATRDGLIKRVSSVHEHSPAQWGKMNAYQMIKHLRRWEELANGTLQAKRIFIGRIIGKLILKAVLKDEEPIRRNSPSAPETIVQDASGDIAAEKAKFMELVNYNAANPIHGFVHPFFGKMTHQQIGQLAYKHIDHHLRQFNV